MSFEKRSTKVQTGVYDLQITWFQNRMRGLKKTT